MSHPAPFHSIQTKRGQLNLREAKAHAVAQVSTNVVSSAARAAGIGIDGVRLGGAGMPVVKVGQT